MKLKNLALAFALGIAALSFSQVPTAAPNPKITFKTVAVPVGVALAEISKQAGIRLTASPQVAGEIVVLALKDVPLADLKTQIAKACSAKWEATEGGEILVADLVQRRQEDQKERSEAIAEMAKQLKQRVDALNPPKRDPKAKVDDEEEFMMEQYMAMGASNKAIILLANALGAANLSAIDAKSRVVYSSHPNRMQKPLAGNYNQILSQLVAEHNKEAAERQKERSQHPVEENEQMKRMREMFGDFDESEDGPVEGTPSKAILVVSRQQLMGGLTLQLKVFNEKGQVVIRGTQMLSTGGGMFSALDLEEMEFGPDGLPKAKPQTNAPAGEKPIVFSDATKELSEMSNVTTMANSTRKMSDELKMKLLNPDQFDPLSFSHSEALIALATQKGKPLVACLPDAMETLMGMYMPKPEGMTPSAYSNSVKNAVFISTDGPFVYVKPVNSAKSRRDRLDRVALGQFLRSVDAKGSVILDDLAVYAQRSNSPMEDSLAMSYFMIFAPNAIQSGMGGQVSWDMLRFYGGLSANQKRNMADGGRLTYGQLSQIQQAALRQMTFGPETALVVEDPNAKKPTFEMPSFLRGVLAGAMGKDYRTEPTELMPNGLTNDGYVQLKLTQDTVAKPTGNISAMFGSAVLGADELAMLKMFKDMPGMEQMASFMPTIDEVRLGERSVYEFKFFFAPGVTMDKTLNDDRVAGNAPAVKVSNLPSEFAKKIEERLAAFKKLPFFDPSFFQGGGGGVTPP